jgi:hypothetical protein
MNNENLENIYDKYAAMLYGIALQIYPVQKNAEQILIYTFKKIHEQDITPEKHPAFCITLIHLVIKTARELYPVKFKNNFRLNQFEKTPLLNQLICDRISLKEYRKEKHLTEQAGLQIIFKEFSIIRNFENKNVVSADNTISSETVVI